MATGLYIPAIIVVLSKTMEVKVIGLGKGPHICAGYSVCGSSPYNPSELTD